MSLPSGACRNLRDPSTKSRLRSARSLGRSRQQLPRLPDQVRQRRAYGLAVRSQSVRERGIDLVVRDGRPDAGLGHGVGCVVALEGCCYLWRGGDRGSGRAEVDQATPGDFSSRRPFGDGPPLVDSEGSRLIDFHICKSSVCVNWMPGPVRGFLQCVASENRLAGFRSFSDELRITY